VNGYHNEHFCTSRRVTLFVNERNGGKQNWIFSKKMEIRFDPKLESMDLDLVGIIQRCNPMYIKTCIATSHVHN